MASWTTPRGWSPSTCIQGPGACDGACVDQHGEPAPCVPHSRPRARAAWPCLVHRGASCHHGITRRSCRATRDDFVCGSTSLHGSRARGSKAIVRSVGKHSGVPRVSARVSSSWRRVHVRSQMATRGLGLVPAWSLVASGASKWSSKRYGTKRATRAPTLQAACQKPPRLVGLSQRVCPRSRPKLPTPSASPAVLGQVVEDGTQEETMRWVGLDWGNETRPKRRPCWSMSGIALCCRIDTLDDLPAAHKHQPSHVSPAKVGWPSPAPLRESFRMLLRRPPLYIECQISLASCLLAYLTLFPSSLSSARRAWRSLCLLVSPIALAVWRDPWKSWRPAAACLIIVARGCSLVIIVLRPSALS